MKLKNNYNECLTNLACSIRKYFGLEYKHNTLSYIDKILEENKPKNVVTILCDGMGSYILDRTLSKDSFLLKNKLKTITSVFPATTVAATTSMITGLNPVETGMLGWHMYYKDLDKVITTYMSSLKGDPDQTYLEEAYEYRKNHMNEKSIVEEINELGKNKGYILYPFGENPYTDLDDMYNKIETLCNEEGNKYIYAYDTEPDESMHVLGTDNVEIKNIIEDINNRIENLSKRVKDTIIFVVADHGHKNVINIHLDDYKDIVDCLDKDISIESRAVNFFIKENKKEEFVSLFNKYFGKDFNLYTKNEIIESKLFGDGEENKIFRDVLGDYLAIAINDKALVYRDCSDIELKSRHAGYTDDEVYVPLIVINTHNIK